MFHLFHVALHVPGLQSADMAEELIEKENPTSPKAGGKRRAACINDTAGDNWEAHLGCCLALRWFEARHEDVRVFDLYMGRDATRNPVVNSLNATGFVETQQIGNLCSTAKRLNQLGVLGNLFTHGRYYTPCVAEVSNVLCSRRVFSRNRISA